MIFGKYFFDTFKGKKEGKKIQKCRKARIRLESGIVGNSSLVALVLSELIDIMIDKVLELKAYDRMNMAPPLCVSKNQDLQELELQFSNFH